MLTKKLFIMAVVLASTLAAGVGIARARPIDSYLYQVSEYGGHSYVTARAESAYDNMFRLEYTDYDAYIQTESGVSYVNYLSWGPIFNIPPWDTVSWVGHVMVDSQPVEGSCVDASAAISVVDFDQNSDSETNDGCSTISW